MDGGRGGSSPPCRHQGAPRLRLDTVHGRADQQPMSSRTPGTVRDEWLIKPQHTRTAGDEQRSSKCQSCPSCQCTGCFPGWGDLTFLVTDYGRPFSIEGIGGRSRIGASRAELDHCSAHRAAQSRCNEGRRRRTVPQRHSSRQFMAGRLAGGGSLHGQDGAKEAGRGGDPLLMRRETGNKIVPQSGENSPARDKNQRKHDISKGVAETGR